MKKDEFDTLVSNEATASLIKSLHNYYEFGGKPSRLLAANTTSGPTMNPKTIYDQFFQF